MRLSTAPSFVVNPISGFSTDLIESLRERRARDEHGLFVAEGARFLCAARDQKIPIAGIAFCEERTPRATREIIAQATACPVLKLKAERFDRLCRTEDPSHGVLLVLRQTWRSLPDQVGRRDLWLGVETIRNPGNLGTLLRSAVAAGARGLMVFGPPRDRADPFDPGCVRSSMGAIGGLQIVATSHREFRAWDRRFELRVFGATGEGSRDYRSVDMKKSCLIMLGHERSGLSDAQRLTSDSEIRIPMAGPTDSLNVAMAGTLLLYEAFNQRNPVAKRK